MLPSPQALEVDPLAAAPAQAWSDQGARLLRLCAAEAETTHIGARYVLFLLLPAVSQARGGGCCGVRVSS